MLTTYGLIWLSGVWHLSDIACWCQPEATPLWAPWSRGIYIGHRPERRGEIEP